MITEVIQIPQATGLDLRLPQTTGAAQEIVNFVVDKTTGGWSTRVGYEPYVVGATSWSPFTNDGPIYALHVAQGLSGGARQHTYYETDGNLYLLYDAGGHSLQIYTLATGRHIPTATEAASWFTDTPYGTVITNGVDRPVIVQPWPLGTGSEVSAMIGATIRNFGFNFQPPPVEVAPTIPFPGHGAPLPLIPTTMTPPGGHNTCIWALTDARGIADGGRWGMGRSVNTSDSDVGEESLFGWACSFVSNTGSEGPTSTLSTSSWLEPILAKGFRQVAQLGIPLGPKGTVARKIYRTANFSQDGPTQNDTTLYFVGLLRNNEDDLFFDAVRSADLGQDRPTIATGPLPAPSARFSALFERCLWLDGGVDDGFTLFYSAPGLIEQFGAANFIELSGQGGQITALWGNYQALVVFRERGIDVITGTYTEGFSVTTVANGVTCFSPHSIQTIPGLGVLFLAIDGVYAITGGTTGGAQVDVVKLTSRISEFIERITLDCFPKAVSTFSAKTREYHLYVPLDGNDRPSEGLVLHVDKLEDATGASPWTVRQGFPVGAIATRHDGTILFGHHTGDEAGAGSENERGLFVISRRRSMGLAYDAQGQTLYYTGPGTSTYRSTWMDFGDPRIKKQVAYVTLWLLTTGDPTCTIRHYKDFDLAPVEERTYKAQPPDAADLPVFDTATIGLFKYKKARLATVRFSIAQQSSSWFAWEFQTQEDLILLGYEVGYISKGVKTIMGKRG